MKSKTLSVALTLLVAVMVATSLVGPAQACRRRRPQTFEATIELRNANSEPYPGGFSPPNSFEFFGPQNPEWINPMNPDGYKYRLAKGFIAWGQIDCVPLGIGKMTLAHKWWLSNFETGIDFVLADYILEFDGDYGDYIGTLTGTFFKKVTFEPPMYDMAGYGAFLEGTDQLEGIKIISKVNLWLNVAEVPPILRGEMTGRIWGLP